MSVKRLLSLAGLSGGAFRERREASQTVTARIAMSALPQKGSV
jgi:hypothetical protein